MRLYPSARVTQSSLVTAGTVGDPMADAKSGDARYGVTLTNLDQPLFDRAGATKRDLVEYLDGVTDRILPVLENRPLSVIRSIGARRRSGRRTPQAHPRVGPDRDHVGGELDAGRVLRLVQRPPHAPGFANQRAVEYHGCGSAGVTSPGSCGWPVDR